METKEKKRLSVTWWLALAAPFALVLLFQALKWNRPAMDGWVFGVLAPVEQCLGRLWSLVPFSAAEALTALFLVGNAAWIVAALAAAIRRRGGRELIRRLLALAAVWLWLWAGVCWLWNAAYYAASFAQRSGLEVGAYSVEELAAVTAYFSQNAAHLADQVPRDGEGRFAEGMEDCFERGPSIYENLTREFPCLSMEAVRAKPLFFSRLQSMLGFTGIYFPFTGEANVNVDAPACLVPATIAHEMAHQRMVASELEANFVGIAAAVTSGDPVFQYSGYLMGLIQLCNALYPADGQAWQNIVDQYFTRELAIDWNDNNAYWAALESPVEDAAGQAYDTFLKGNGQELGMRSYGACVDLLVAYFAPLAGEA